MSVGCDTWQAIWRSCLGMVTGCLLIACGSGSGSGSSDSVANPPAGSSDPAPELSNLTQAINVEVSQGSTVTAQISFSNTGDAGLTYTLTTNDGFISLANSGQALLAAGQSTSVNVDLTCSGADESGSVRVETNDADESLVLVSVSVTCLTPEPLNVARLTLNQAARAYDSDLGAAVEQELVAGRDLLVRAFLVGSNPPPAADVVIISTGGTEQRFAMQVPASIGAQPAAESNLSASHHAVIPAASVQPGSSLRIDSANGSYPATPLDLNVQDPGTFRITFVPVTHAGQTPDIDAEAYLRQTLRQLPIGEYDIQVRSPYVFNGDYELDRLLDEMLDLRALDGSSRLYHGVIISPNSSSQTAGIGYVGFPVSVSIDLGGGQNIIAHEIGHNLDLRHAPGCDAPNADGAFPNANGAVTTWGYDIAARSLVSPSATRRDLMSYCGDLWISDFHFQKALAYRVQSPIAQAPGDSSLLLRGRIQAGMIRDLTWLPLDQPAPVPSRRPHRYQLRAWDASGTLLGEYPFDAHTIADSDAGAGFSVVLPDSFASMHHYEIHSGGNVVHSGAWRSARSASSLAVEWQAEAARVSWSKGNSKDVLIARNQEGQVIAIDRSGSMRLPTMLAATARLELRGVGQRSQHWQMLLNRQPEHLAAR